MKKQTDANDLMQQPEGLEKLKAFIQNPLLPQVTPPTNEPLAHYVNGIKPMNIKYNKQGNPILPPEFEIANELVKYYDGILCQSEGSLFLYKDNYWQEMDDFAIGNIITQIHTLCGFKATQAKAESVLKLFRKSTMIPKSPSSLFILNPYLVNFLNGTLHIFKEHGSWLMKFKPHNRGDYCTSMIPIEYDTTRSIRNPEFEAMLDRIFDKADDKAEKIKALRQMYGGCLAPIFPHLFMIHGPGGTGKTSLIMGAAKLVHKNNMSSVDPSEFKGFLMESMAGKLVNIVTEVNLREPIDDAHIKKIEDRYPIRIDRKFKTAIMAPLPAVHVFGGNDIPATYEKGSGAHTRRWTFIEVSGFTAQGSYSKDFANEVFQTCPVGVLNFALDGLSEVLGENGHYFTPLSGREKMKKWQMEHDSIALFVDEIEQGEVVELKMDDKSKLERSALWRVYVLWHRDTYSRMPRMGKIKFYEAISGKSLAGQSLLPAKIEGVYYFKGLSVTGKLRPMQGQIMVPEDT
jgi:hypothetical protein